MVIANIISKLLDGTEDDALLALQLCFDLMETGDQHYVTGVAKSLPEKTESDAEDSSSSAVSRSDEVWVRYEQALKVLTGGFASELSLSFLHKNSDSDPLIMQNLKKALDERGASRSSILHNCSVSTHSYLNAGTTNDAFLRDNLEWMKKASNWSVQYFTFCFGRLCVIFVFCFAQLSIYSFDSIGPNSQLQRPWVLYTLVISQKQCLFLSPTFPRTLPQQIP